MHMKIVNLLVTLAALAGVTVNATTVGLTSGNVDSGSSGTSYNSLSFGGNKITTTGYFWNQSSTPDAWASSTVAIDSNGVGVTNTSSSVPVQSALNEFIVLDFGHGTTTISSLGLYFAQAPSSTSQWFTYSWQNSAPVAGQTTPNPSTFTSFSQGSPSFTSAGVYTFNMSSAGSGRYLILGATDFPSQTNTGDFRVNTVTYTTVPDGASTLALMGAAIATLGFASRRRRA